MNKFKKFLKKFKYAISVIAIVLLVGVFSVVKADGLSLKELIAQIVGNNITNELKSSGVLDDIKAEDLSFGAAAGTDHYQTERFWAGFGGAVYATTTNSTSETITEGLLQKYSVFEITPLVGALTWTLPATSTIGNLLKNEGDTQTWVFHNTTTTVGASFTLAKGAGWDLVGVDANVDVIAGAAVGSQVYMEARCTRLYTATTTNITLAKTITCLLTDNIAVD